MTDVALALRAKVDLGPKQLFRLVGVGLSNFDELEGDCIELVRPVKCDDGNVVLGAVDPKRLMNPGALGL